ncbi:MAG: tRNA-dihydrouridine synthase family protein [Oligoflexus sp.]|nr:tRNA-dihydrouridine synthase family protein [Oligoflexus sp.]
MSAPLSSISVAPMEGMTTFPMRLWLQVCSEPESMTTPFLRVTKVYPDREIPMTFAPELYELRGVLPYGLTPQFIAGDPLQFLRAAEFMPPLLAPILEINCGCPSPNSLGKLAGSGMLHDAETFGRVIENLSRELGPGRLAVKMRLGIEDPSEFEDLLAAVVPLPLARLTVHGRTRDDGYRGKARWESIEIAAKAANIPVVASGDVLGIESLKQLAETAPHLSGAMIGRGVMRNPWVFEELRSGVPTELDLLTLVNALFCYALLQELWQSHPLKLIARVDSGRIGSPCRNNFAAWEKLTVELTSLVYGLPFLLNRGFKMPSEAISTVAFGRLKILWAYLRSGLPEAFNLPSLTRAKSISDFFNQLLIAANDHPEERIRVTHREEWDKLFAGARG